MGPVSLLLRLAAASLRGQARYPLSTLLLTTGQFTATGIEMLAMWALFHRFGSVQGWRLPDVAVFYGLVNIMFAIADALGRGFDVLGSELLRSGQFDRLLLRPRTVTLQLMGHELRISRLGRLLQGLLVLLWAGAQGAYPFTMGNLAVMLFAVAGGTALFLGILVLQGALSFWTVESLELANVLTYGGVQAAQYPLAIYGICLQRLLTWCVPLAAVAYYPALVILQRRDPLGAPPWAGMFSPLAGFAFLALSLTVWRIGVRHYASTGS